MVKKAPLGRVPVQEPLSEWSLSTVCSIVRRCAPSTELPRPRPAAWDAMRNRRWLRRPCQHPLSGWGGIITRDIDPELGDHQPPWARSTFILRQYLCAAFR